MSKIKVNGYEIDFDSFRMSTCGEVGFAYKDGVKKFCKKFNNPVDAVDNGTSSKAAQAKNRKIFQAFTARRCRINNKLREISKSGGNIIRPEAEFVYNAHWYEITEFLPDVVPEDQVAAVIKEQTDEEKLRILKIAVQSLRTVHTAGIVHADLKLPNIMLVKTTMNTYASKIIDFDGSFFEDDVPLEGITGTIDYFSPELAAYFQHEDPEERALRDIKRLTRKSDIFTMGLVLYKYLTGEFPQANHLSESLRQRENRYIYPWQIVRDRNKDGSFNQLRIDSGKIKYKWLVALISDMLQLDYTKRPSTAEIISAMDRKSVTVEPEWPEDNIEFNTEKIKADYAGLKREKFTKKDGTVIRYYVLIDNDGIRHCMDANDLKKKKLAKDKAEILPPKEEDGIVWTRQLTSDYIGIQPIDDKKGFYLLTRKNGIQQRMNVEQLTMNKLANKKEPPKQPSTSALSLSLWEEDAKKYELLEGAQTAGVSFAGRCVSSEEDKRRRLYYVNRNSGKFRVPVGTLLMYKLVKKK